MTTSAQRQQLLNWVGEAAQAGARQQRACHIGCI
jgi:hypothetical protein